MITKNQEKTRINDSIRVPNVRLIGEDGEQVGIVKIKDALRIAEEHGLDLVEIAPTAKPPVCRIMDYGKYRYQQSKKEKLAKKKQHQVQLKEVQFRPRVDVHDYETKMRKAKEFLDEKNMLKVLIRFRGRELAHKDLGIDLANRIIEELKEIGETNNQPKLVGRAITLMFSPVKSK